MAKLEPPPFDLESSEAKLDDAVRQISLAVEFCLQNNLPLPAMQLLYAAMDVMGHLNGPDDPPRGKPPSKNPKKGSRYRFQRWVRRYILRKSGARYRAVDLYSARCGVLHEFGFNSELAKAGLAKKALYTWGNADVRKMEALIRHLRARSKCVAIDLDHLYVALKQGIEKFKRELAKNPRKRRSVLEKVWEFPATFTTDGEGRITGSNHPEAIPAFGTAIDG